MKIILSLLFAFHFAWALSPSTAAFDPVWQSVVFIKVPGPDASGDVVEGLCNATLLNSKTLLTAAHCFLRSTVLQGGSFKIEVGHYNSSGYRTTDRFERTAHVAFLPGVNPQSTKISPDLDIAIVHLKTDLELPNDFPFANLWNKKLPKLDSNSQITVITINPLETITHNDTKQMATLNSIQQKNFQIESRSTSRVQEGDSGAPVFAFLEGGLYVIGVVKGRGQSFLSNWDVLVTSQGRF